MNVLNPMKIIKENTCHKIRDADFLGLVSKLSVLFNRKYDSLGWDFERNDGKPIFPLEVMWVGYNGALECHLSMSGIYFSDSVPNGIQQKIADFIKDFDWAIPIYSSRDVERMLWS